MTPNLAQPNPMQLLAFPLFLIVCVLAYLFFLFSKKRRTVTAAIPKPLKQTTTTLPVVVTAAPLPTPEKKSNEENTSNVVVVIPTCVPPPPTTTIIPDAVRKAISLLQSPDWTLRQQLKKDNIPTISFYDKPVLWCGKKACKFSVECTPRDHIVTSLDQIRTLLQEYPSPSSDTETRENNSTFFAFQYDNLLEGIRLVNENSDHHVLHTWYNTPLWGIAKRDMITQTYDYNVPVEHFSELGYDPSVVEEIFIQSSIDASTTLPPYGSYVRGVIHMFGVVAMKYKNSGNIIIHQVMSIDPCGWLPSKAIDATNYEQLEKVRIMLELCEKMK